MTFTTFLYQLILCSMILPTIALFMPAIIFPSDPVYLAAVIFGYAVAILAHENLLSFFTIQKNMLTRIITIILLGSGFIIFADSTIPGVKVSVIDSLKEPLKDVVIGEQDVSKYVTILLISLISGLIYIILKELKKKVE